MTLENQMKFEGAMSKNVRSSIFQKILAKTLGGYFGAPKMDFNDSKCKTECTLMDILSFWSLNQNRRQSISNSQITALLRFSLKANIIV